jgi:hypothetical protein
MGRDPLSGDIVPALRCTSEEETQRGVKSKLRQTVRRNQRMDILPKPDSMGRNDTSVYFKAVGGAVSRKKPQVRILGFKRVKMPMAKGLNRFTLEAERQGGT